MEDEDAKLPRAQDQLIPYVCLARTITQTPSLYLEAGAIHGCVLAKGANPLIYMEDVAATTPLIKSAAMSGSKSWLNATGQDYVYHGPPDL